MVDKANYTLHITTYSEGQMLPRRDVYENLTRRVVEDMVTSRCMTKGVSSIIVSLNGKTIRSLHCLDESEEE